MPDPKTPNTQRLDAMVRNLTKRGVALPRDGARRALAANEMHNMAVQGLSARHSDLLGAKVSVGDPTVQDIERQNALVRAMGSNRGLRRKAASTGYSYGPTAYTTRTASSGSLAGSDTYSAIPRFYDPIEYWDLSGLPWNMADEGHRHKLHKWMRLYYATHYLVPTLIDIYTRFPLVGMRLETNDKALARFYEDLFLEQLDYPEFYVSLGREVFTVGEAFPLGSFDEDLGVWEREELINPEDVVIENFPLLGSKQLKIVPPEYLKKLAQNKAPAKEYKQLQLNFPELIPYLMKNERIPISGVLLKQVANRINTWDDHGTPILLRGLRTLIHEEKLLASQDAIAERLYSPLILAKLGIMDLGDGQGAWVPTPDELESFRDDMDIALASDFRLMVYHMGLEVESVFGREQMPRLGDDFDRIERRIMQIFGINPSLLSAGSNSQPYASSALQAEFMNQMLRTYQLQLKKHFKERALVVAEAQGHYDYEVRGQTRVPIMEQVVEYDEEGNKHIVEKHKLLVPELEFEVLDMRDEATERQFMQSLRAMGVPIPDQKLMVGVDFDIEELDRETNDELVMKTILQQQAKVKAYKALQAANLPIPPDLKAEVESVLGGGENQAPSPPPGGLPQMPSGGMGPGGAAGPMGGPGHQIVMPGLPGGMGAPPGLGPGGMGPAGQAGGTPPIAPNGQNIGNGFAPPASFERRQGLPTPMGATHRPDQSDEIDNQKESATVAESVDDTPTVIELPQPKVKKKYTFIDDAE